MENEPKFKDTQAEPQAAPSTDHEPGFVEKLILGELGLPATYWVYGVLAGPIWAIVLNALQPHDDLESNQELLKLGKFAFIGYYMAIYTGIWNAATKYKGNKVWAILAKFVVIITTLTVVIELLKAAP